MQVLIMFVVGVVSGCAHPILLPTDNMYRVLIDFGERSEIQLAEGTVFGSKR